MLLGNISINAVNSCTSMSMSFFVTSQLIQRTRRAPDAAAFTPPPLVVAGKSGLLKLVRLVRSSRLVKRWLSALAAREMAGGDEAASSSLLDLSVLINNLPEEPSPVSVQERGSFEDDLEDALLEPPRPIR